MRWPWVSRALLERVEELLRQTEAERRLLLNHVLAVNGIGVAAASGEATAEDEVLSTAASSLTISGLRAMAEDAAYRRAGRRRDRY